MRSCAGLLKITNVGARQRHRCGCKKLLISISFARALASAVLSAVLPTLLWVPTLAHSQSSTVNPPRPADSDHMLDEVTIIGNMDTDASQITGEVVQDEHTGSHSRITRQRLAQPGAQLGDLLSGASGIQQKQSGGFGTFSTITVRAASAAQTAIFLDGILLNTGGESIIDLSTLEILNLASVDLYKGSTPLQLGHGSMGGAVNLNTLSSDDDKGARIRLGFGSFSYASVLAAHQARTGKWDWTASLSRQQSENDFTFTNDNATPQNALDDERQPRRNNDAKRTAVLLKSGHQRTATHRTDLLVQLAERDVGVPNARNSETNQARYATAKTQIQLSQIIDQWKGWNTRHSLYWHMSGSVYDDSKSQVGLGAQYIDSDIRTLGAKTYWERFLKLGTFGVSVDLRNEKLDLEDELNADENFTADQHLLVATTHMAIVNDDERWMMTPALRWQRSQRRGTSSSIGVPASLPEQNESQLGAQLGLAYTLTPSLTFNTNVGNYFREPSFTELFGSIGLVNGNPSLDPEEGINADIGFAYETDGLHLEFAFFKNTHDNLILTSYDARGIGRPRNTGEADITGLELSTTWKPATNWQLSASATFQNPRNRDPFNGFKNKILPGESRRTGFARMAYQHHDISYWYEWQASAERYYDSANLLPATNTSVHSIGLDLKQAHWHFSARLQNIGDDNVEDYNGFPKPGRSFFVAITQHL